MTEDELRAIEAQARAVRDVGWRWAGLSAHVPALIAEVRRLQGLLDAGGYKTAMLTMHDRALTAEHALRAALNRGTLLEDILRSQCSWCRGEEEHAWDGDCPRMLRCRGLAPRSDTSTPDPAS